MVDNVQIAIVRREEVPVPQTGTKHGTVTRETHYNRAEMVSAILYMSSIYGWTIDPDDMPRKDLAKVFDVSTVTIARVIRELKKGRDIATSMGQHMISLRGDDGQHPDAAAAGLDGDGGNDMA
jgi:hypothetical protein